MYNVAEEIDQRKLLIVEDNPTWADSHKDTFSNLGFDIVRHNGKFAAMDRMEAINILFTQKVDIILLDLIMPEHIFDNSSKTLEREEREGYTNTEEGVRLLEMLDQNNRWGYKKAGSPIIILYTTSVKKKHKELWKRFYGMVEGYINKANNDIEHVKETMLRAHQKRRIYLDFD